MLDSLAMKFEYIQRKENTEFKKFQSVLFICVSHPNCFDGLMSKKTTKTFLFSLKKSKYKGLKLASYYPWNTRDLLYLKE